MRYRVTRDPADGRHGAGFLIYADDRLVARYWHDHRGDEHGIELVDGRRVDGPEGRVTDFLEGGGPQPDSLSRRAEQFLDEHLR